jgi:demethylmenaquinone methyltransferase/2-methoxy-6-polyprenyl-1,4-benzoquinol methylase
MKRPPLATGEERVRLVRDIFSSIPRWYDFLNRLLSLRRDVAWRARAVREMRFPRGGAFLDVATGTADLAIAAALAYPGIAVTGVDFVPGMLAVGSTKVSARGLDSRVSLAEGDAMALAFPDGSFEVAAIAFGIRNIPDREAALREMARVVSPGGQVMVLELTTPRNRLARAAYGIYLNGILPLVGRVLSRNPRAYRYLADSIMNFPSPPEFTALMERAGLGRVRAIPLTFGIAYLHIGEVPGPGGPS